MDRISHFTWWIQVCSHVTVFSSSCPIITTIIKCVSTARNPSCGRVMCSQAAVCSWEVGCHVTIIHDALKITVTTLPPTRHGTWVPTRLPLLPTSGGHHWRPVQTCSLWGHTPPPPPVVLTPSSGLRNMYGCQAGSYTSYLNAFLFIVTCKQTLPMCVYTCLKHGRREHCLAYTYWTHLVSTCRRVTVICECVMQLGTNTVIFPLV